MEADPVNALVAPPEHTFLLFDERNAGVVAPHHFDAAWWHAQGAELGTARGRGTVHFLRARDGGETWVLRHFFRGSWIAHFSRDRYLWTGLERTRPWREWRVTKSLRDLGLPVAVPVAARVIRHGITYTGDLLTCRIENTRTLAHVLHTGVMPADAWQRLGATLRRFHDVGLRHDDLNVANILMHAEGNFHVIDFDRAAIVSPGGWREKNLARFRRSLEKHRRLTASFSFAEDDWSALHAGYHGPPALARDEGSRRVTTP